MTLDRCFEERKLRHARPDILRANKSLEIAEKKLGEAESLLKEGFEDPALLSAYSSMFHSGRALLFRDGIVEKSHYCLISYLKEKYVKTGKLDTGIITFMDAFREERHEVMYSIQRTKVEKKEIELAIGTSKKLLEAVTKVLKP